MRREAWGNVGIAVLAAITVLLIVLAVQKQQRPTATPATAEAVPIATATATAKRPVAVFIGDAYTAGVGGEGTRWTALAADRLGWQEVNLANGGTGYLTSATGATAQAACGKDRCPAYGDVVGDAVAASPDIIVVSGGRIDATRDVSSAAKTLFTDLHSKAPAARIIAVSPLWDDATAPSYLTTESRAVQKAASQVGVEFLGIGQPLAGRSDLMTADGVYPNPAGHAAIAEAVTSALAAAPSSSPTATATATS